MVLRDLLSVFLGQDDQTIGTDFPKMVELAVQMYRDVDAALWTGAISPELRAETYQRDIRINQYERSIRKRVLTHLAASDGRDVAYCFILINVVKDAERIGDYVKNLIEDIVDPGRAPDGELKTRIRKLALDIGHLLDRVGSVFVESDEVLAEQLVRQGREFAGECEAVVREVAESGYSSGPTVSLVLLARFYKRIAAHATNILSSVIMPAHKIDFFDEDELDGTT